MKYVKTFEDFSLNESELKKSHFYSELLDIQELSAEFFLNPDDLKNWIDEMQKSREESHQNLIKNRPDLNSGRGFVEIDEQFAKESLINFLSNERILVSAAKLDSKVLKDRGVNPGPEFGKLIKDYQNLYRGKYMTPEKYEENIDNFLKERGY